MHIFTEHPSDKSIIDDMEIHINKTLSEITPERIEATRKEVLAKISKKPLFAVISNKLDYNKEFSCSSMNLFDYISSGAADLVNYITDITIGQIVYFNLMNEGFLMPLHAAISQSVNVDIKYSDNNIVFRITPDMLPYDSFCLVKKL